MKNLCYVLLLFILSSFAQEKALKVFILAGQSNMLGKRSVISKLPDHLKAPQKDVLFYSDKNGWQPITPGKTEKQGFGPELSFGYEIQKLLGEKIGIIKYSIGGTNLHTQWNHKKPNSLYHKTLKLYKSAAEKQNIEVVGFIWAQGGADAKRKEDAEAYAANYKSFIESWSKDLNSPNLKVVCGRCGTSPKPEQYRKKKPYIDIVRQAQDKLDYKNYICVDLDDLPTGPDAVHFDTPGMLESGVRYAKAMYKLMSKP